MPSSPTLDDLCSFLELYGSMVVLQPSNEIVKSHPIAPLGGEFRGGIEFHGAGAAEPVLPAAPLQGVSTPGGAGAGAEQWYKTIAKLMQGRNRKMSTPTCEPRSGAREFSHQRWSPQND